ncbi:MAG TPA: LysR family transcriptional regulator [Propionibacterium sp.]|nr:LysR family transcriptional regulator [Propionibacterium sp.]
MNLRDLEYLIAVADEGSFRGAARRCAVSQPTLSAQVKRLEAQLGAELLDRSASPVRPTEVGEEVVRRARLLIRDADQLRIAVATHRPPESGAIRLGIFPTLAPYLLPQALGSMRESFPGIDLLVTERKTEKLLRMLDAGELDAVLAAVPLPPSAPPGLEHLPLFREEILLALPIDHELARRPEPIDSHLLAGVDVTLLAPGHCLNDQVEGWLDAVGARGRDDYRASSVEILRSMIANGPGVVSLLPALSLQDARAAASEELVTRRLVDPVPARDIALVWRSDSAIAPLLRRVASALVPEASERITVLLPEG